MPLTGDAKREYQRKKMAERRAAEAKLARPANPAPTTKSGPRQPLDRFKPYRDEFGDLVLRPAIGDDLGGEHYWGSLSAAPNADSRVCTVFDFAGKFIGGCGMIKAWEGKLLDGQTFSQIIADSPHAKEIQQKMPVTKGRER